MPSLPFSAKNGDAIFKAISDTAYCYEPVNLQCLSTAAVLTVVDKIPSQRGAVFFRPSYLKGQKKLVSINNMHWELLPSLAPPTGVTIPSIASVKASIERVQNDWLPVHDGRVRPKLNTPTYGADISARNNEALFRLFLNDPLPQRKQLAISLVQYGLDLFATHLDGQLWPAGGGHGFGRKGPIVFAGTMLQDSEIKAVLAVPDEYRFGEVSSTYINPTNGQAYYGEDISSCHPVGKPFDFQYWDSMRSHATARMCRNPYPNDPIDGGERVGALYQTCCSSGFMQATYVAFHLMPSLNQFHYDEGFMKYSKRWIDHGPVSAGDSCAPAIGTCEGGDNDGTQTTSALGRLVCTGLKLDGKPAEFKADMTKYMVDFGNDGTSECIKDTSPFDPLGRFDGYGRFPFEDGFNQTDYGMTPFQKKMQAQYFSPD